MIIPSIIIWPLMLPIIINVAIIIISSQYQYNNEKASPFECGFDPTSKSRTPFSTQFFLLAVIFLVFDVEVALLLLLPVIINVNLSILYLNSLTAVLFILILGLYHEWNEGSLSWNNYN